MLLLNVRGFITCYVSVFKCQHLRRLRLTSQDFWASTSKVLSGQGHRQVWLSFLCLEALFLVPSQRIFLSSCWSRLIFIRNAETNAASVVEDICKILCAKWNPSRNRMVVCINKETVQEEMTCHCLSFGRLCILEENVCYSYRNQTMYWDLTQFLKVWCLSVGKSSWNSSGIYCSLSCVENNLHILSLLHTRCCFLYFNKRQREKGGANVLQDLDTYFSFWGWKSRTQILCT